jgi:hypothetical protein
MIIADGSIEAATSEELGRTRWQSVLQVKRVWSKGNVMKGEGVIMRAALLILPVLFVGLVVVTPAAFG